ncbi:MAG: hypothetical protein GC183_08055 [Thiobacillus sp.]|nr:hypothetical protein [Thiobacillus sp.]
MELPESWLHTAEQLCGVLRKEAACLRSSPVIRLQDAVFVEGTDPANNLPSYEGIWRNPQGVRCGSLTLNSDGSYYAEFDVLTLHPDKPNWFVEAVTVWGRDGVVKAEPRLLAAV